MQGFWLSDWTGGVVRAPWLAHSMAMQQLEFPGAVSTEGYNINQDGSVVGHYESPDGRRYGFIARPVSGDRPIVAPAVTTYTYESINVVGVDHLAVTASSDLWGLRRLHEKCRW